MREEPGKMDRVEEIFDDALEQLMMGESLDDILARYPGVAADLRPMLITAQRVQAHPPLQMPASSLASMMARAQAQAAVDRERKAAPLIAAPALGAEDEEIKGMATRAQRPSLKGPGAAAPLPLMERMKKWLRLGSPAYRTAISITFALLLVFTTLAVVAALSRPDTPVVPDPPTNQAFDLQGVIQSIEADRWVVNNTDIYLTSDTIIEGNPRTGATAQIEGTIDRDERRTANRIVVDASTVVLSTDTPTLAVPTPTSVSDWPIMPALATSAPTESTATTTDVITTTDTPAEPTVPPTSVIAIPTGTRPISATASSVVPVPTNTNRPSATFTSTPLLVATATTHPPTDTATSTPSATAFPPTSTATNTSTPTPSSTSTEQPTQTPLFTATTQPTDTPQPPDPTSTASESEPVPTNTQTNTPEAQPQPTDTRPPTTQPTNTSEPTREPTEVPTSTGVPTQTRTPRPTETKHEPEPTHTPDDGGPGPSPSNTPHSGGGGPGPSPSNTPDASQP